MNQPNDPKKVFVAATQKDQGKTTVSLGLMAAFGDLLPPVGFIKPVGQRYVECRGVRVDEDVALMRAIFPAQCELADMSPVTVGRSFTREYIQSPHPEVLAQRIRESFARTAEGMGSVVIEGTGHAGVGSCFDSSNADVAHMLGAKVILVAGGGIGRPIDEVMLNESLFRDRSVEILGVILNKVLPSKLEQVHDVVGKGLGRLGIELLGCIPLEPALEAPSVHQILHELPGELLNGEASLENSIDTVIVGAMAAHRALEYLSPKCLLITPGDRDDLILAAMSTCTPDHEDCLAGLLLTGGVMPHPNTLEVIRRTQIPVIIVQGDSYGTATTVNNLKVKIQPSDKKKIHIAPQLVRDHVDVKRILERL
jgi:BioD-like phosphotransacetylase family protein